MGVLGEKGSVWCFCSGGGGRSERVKGSIYMAKGPAIASICGITGEDRSRRCGTGFMIHRGLLLTTHTNIPSVAVAEAGCEVRLGFGRVVARLVPQRFFITSSILDLTIVGLDPADSDTTPQYIKTGFTTTIDLGNITYLLGHTKPRNDLTIDEGKVVISTDNLIKLSTDGVSFSAGSAGFDMHGNLAFMLCDPMKLATSPMCRTSNSGVGSCAYSLSRKDLPMQFGIPVPVILDWLRQHWKGSLDDVSNPKLTPPLRLVSTGEVQGTGLKHENGESSSSNPRVQLLDINCPPRPVPAPVLAAPTSIFLPLPLKHMLSEGSHNNSLYKNDDTLSTSVSPGPGLSPSRPRYVPSPSRSEVESNQETNCSPVYSDLGHERYYDDGFNSGDDETMYSAETMESRNIPSPRKAPCNSRVSVGRSQSCVNGTRWSSPGSSAVINSNSNNRRGTLTKQTSLVSVRRTNSQTGTQRSHDFLSPTVASSMKKRNSVEEQKPARGKQVGNQGPSRWL